jgi:hypothetical protein
VWLDKALPDPPASSAFGDDELAQVRPKPEVVGTGKPDDPGVVFPAAKFPAASMLLTTVASDQ